MPINSDDQERMSTFWEIQQVYYALDFQVYFLVNSVPQYINLLQEFKSRYLPVQKIYFTF